MTLTHLDGSHPNIPMPGFHIMMGGERACRAMIRKPDNKNEMSVRHMQGINGGEGKHLALPPPRKRFRGDSATNLMGFSHQKFKDVAIRLLLGVPWSLAALHNFSIRFQSIGEVLAGKRSNAR